MKRTDFYVQTVLILIGVIAALSFLVTPDNIGMILAVQFFLGAWQMISALFFIGLRTTYKKGRQVHLAVASIYLMFICLIWNTFREMDLTLVSVLLTVPAWILAIHYYTITCLTVFPKKRNDSAFLPHLNF